MAGRLERMEIEFSSSDDEDTPKTTANDSMVLGYRVNFLKPLGSGGFGTVYKSYGEDGKPVAMKMLHKTNASATSKESIRSHFMKNEIDHKNIVKIVDVKTCENSMWIIMEYFNRGDLNNFYKTRKQSVLYSHDFGLTIVPGLMRDIATGLAFLHDKGIVHRDIKPMNILVKKYTNGDLRAKLGDFGLSKILDPDDETSAMSSDVGTLAFKAPEFWDRKPNRKVRYHRNVDVYATGITFAAMLHAEPGKPLVPKAQCKLKASETNMAIGLIAFTRKTDVNVVGVLSRSRVYNDDLHVPSLINDMTRTSASQRISASEVLSRL